MKNNNYSAFSFWLGLWLLVFQWVAGVSVSQAASATGGPDPQFFASSVQTLRDNQKTLAIDDLLTRTDILWQNEHSAALNFGIMSDVLWLRLELPASHAPITRLFEVANHKISNLTLYVVRNHDGVLRLDTTYQSGSQVLIKDRPYPNRNYVFPVELVPKSSTYLYLRIHNDFPMKLPLFLWDETGFRNQVESRALFQGIYFGVIVIMAIYNLCIYLFVRDKSYGTYTMFILCLAGYVLVDRGLAMEYVWPKTPDIDFQMTLIFTALGCAASVPFTVNFLSLRQNAPRFAAAFNYLFGLWMAIAAAAIVYPSYWLLYVSVLVLIPGGTSLLVVGMLMWKRGVPAAPYYTIAWAVMVTAATVYDAYLLGLFPVSIFTEYSLQVGSMIEVTLLSIGLAYRIKTLDAEKREARLITEAKSEFLATMSHEIRTPMNGILGMAELMRDTPLTQRQQAYLDTILNSGQTLLTVLNDILDFSKIEAGKLDLESVPFNPRALADDTAAIFAVKAKEKKLRYHVFIAPDVPEQMRGDPGRMRQVLGNLISNAFKFTREGSVTLRVRLADERDGLLFEVTDTGIGIEASKVNAIFEKFTQADSSTSRQYGGTGLGLAISRRFIELMGGKIGVRSRLGQGSTFWFSLPLLGPDAATMVSDTRVPLSSHLWLVSADAALITHLQRCLQRWGLEVTELSSLQHVDDHAGASPDYVLVDQHCADFSAGGIKKLLEPGTRHAGTQMILLLDIGTPRAPFENLPTVPWIEEFPLSIDRLKNRFYASTPAVQIDAPAPSEPPPDFSHMRVLVVDDNDVNALVISGFLRKLGIQPNVAKSGRDAIEQVCGQSHRFDLILMDCEMPEVDGYQATLRIREWERLHATKPQTICALSAHALQSYRDKCLQAGMDDFLSKPILFEQLKAKVGEYRAH